MRHYHIKRRFGRSRAGNFMVYLILALMGAFLVLPLLYAVLNSLKPYDEIFLFPPRLFVSRPTLEHYSDLFLLSTDSLVPFSRYIFNSLLLALVTTIGTILIASAAAYPLAKGEFPGKKAIFGVVVTSLLFVSTVTAVPQYIILSKMHLLNTYFALILPSLGAAFGVFLMKQFMDNIPYSLMEATRIDGGSEYTILFRIVLPIVKPAWLTLAIFVFQSSWNNTGLNFIFDESLKLLPTALTELSAGNTIARMGISSAATVILMLPPILFFILAQSRVLETMASAGIKE